MTTEPIQSITDEQIAEIEALASKATHGAWQYHAGEEDPESSWAAQFPIITAEDGEVIGTEGFYSEKDRDEANAAHVAASCPSNVLAIIARLRAAERDAARYIELAVNANENCRIAANYLSIYRPQLADEFFVFANNIDRAMKGEKK